MIFNYLLQDFHVKSGTKFLIRDKRSFEISDVEITRINCIYILVVLSMQILRGSNNFNCANREDSDQTTQMHMTGDIAKICQLSDNALMRTEN